MIILLAGCNFPPAKVSSTASPATTTIQGLQQTLISFKVNLSEPLPAGDSLYLTLLDEVSGLAFNAHKYIMQADAALNYSVSLPFTIGKVLKYRYSREGAISVDEHLYNDQPVRYRLYHVEGPGIVQDVIRQWTDTEYAGVPGRIMGKVLDSSTGNPVANILVAGGGEQAFTLADGTFLLEGLPPGTHNVVFYSLDGGYRIYQQGAVIAPDSTTPVTVQLKPAAPVTVIFTVRVPAETPVDAPIRLAGNIYQLGNTFADLSGGVSTLAVRMPVLGKLSDDVYMVTLSLPAGTYLEYKYTLGDGLWSSELTTTGTIRLRQLIVPDTSFEENDVVDRWLAEKTKAIRFEVKVPAYTPQNESISIQFNPGFGWLEALPMWLASNSPAGAVWRFDLTGPFNNLGTIRYRYCRQGQCGSADDAETAGINPTGRKVDLSTKDGTVSDEVTQWAWFGEPQQPPTVPDIQVTPRSADFVAGVAFQPRYHPSWGPLLPTAINEIQTLGVNWLVLQPTWTFTNVNLPILEPLPAQDILWPDLNSSINTAHQAGGNIALFPAVHFPAQANQWWQEANRDYSWWVSFYEKYSNFILHHAALAADTKVSALILGGEWLDPALPGGLLADGSPSGVLQDSEARWRDLIEKIRQRYSGAIAWAVRYPEGVINPPPFLDAVDVVYILWSAPLADQPGALVDEMEARAVAILDQDVLPFQQRIHKPIILAISYPSIDRGNTGCIAIQGGGCLDYDSLIPPNPDIRELTLDLQNQVGAYNAVLSAINERSWIAGYVSMGYFPPAILQDKSISIHGKPASGVLWYWSQKYLGR